MNTLQAIKVENKRAARENEATKQQAEAKLPITYAKAWVNYSEIGAGARTPWHLHIEFYPGGELNRYNPVETLDETHEWLADCFESVAAIIRTKQLHDCRIEVVAEGQPEVHQDEYLVERWCRSKVPTS